MAHTKSAVKRARTSETRRIANRGVRGDVAAARRSFLEAAAGGDAAKSGQQFKAYCSALDKAAKKGVIAKNNADRHKSRAARRLAALSR